MPLIVYISHTLNVHERDISHASLTISLCISPSTTTTTPPPTTTTMTNEEMEKLGTLSL